MKKLLLFVLLLVGMANAALVQSVGGTQASANIVLSMPQSVTAGNRLIITVNAKSATPDSSYLSKSAGTATLGIIRLDTIYNYLWAHSCVFSAPIKTSGSLTITFNQSGLGSIKSSMTLAEFSEIDTSINRKLSTGYNSGVDASPTTYDLSAESNGAVIIGVLSSYEESAITISPGTGYTTIYKQEDGVNYMPASTIYKIATTSANNRANWTIDKSVFWQCVGVSYRRVIPLPESHLHPRPSWPIEVLSWDYDKAYPGIEYNYRLAVRGGAYPYTFALITKPNGMVINTHTGEIKWTPSGASNSNNVDVKITDQIGDTLRHTFTIDATISKFYFVATTGSDAANGSEVTPWLTMAHAVTTADSESFVYVKTGTYNETFTISHNNCGRFLAYPGSTVTITGAGTTTGSFAIDGGTKRVFQGFTFNANDLRWLFSCSGYTNNCIWRNNTMQNVYSNDMENPAFIFFGDGSTAPTTGYTGIVIQNNIMHDLRNEHNHGASVTCYDVRGMIYEDNHAYDIDGRGVSDKDNGYKNTIRNNKINNCYEGIAMWNQYTEDQEEVCFNHVYSCTTAVVVGGQPGYIRNIFIHHNTLLGRVVFGVPVNDTASKIITLSKNIIGKGAEFPFTVSPVDTGSNQYDWPSFFKAVDTNKVMMDSNMVWPLVDSTKIAGSGYSIPPNKWTEWQSKGFEKYGLIKYLTLTTDSVPVLSDTFQIYGRFGADTVAIIPVLDSAVGNIKLSTATFLRARNLDSLFWHVTNLPDSTSGSKVFTNALNNRLVRWKNGMIISIIPANAPEGYYRNSYATADNGATHLVDIPSSRPVRVWKMGR